MTTERDPNLLIAAWLEEGPRDLPADTRRAIETAVRTMPQRRLGFGRSWRFPPVNGYLRPTLLVAAILISVVGVAVYGRLRPTESVGGPLATSSPTTPASFSPAPPPTPLPVTGRIAFTRYDTDAGMYGNYLGTFIANADGSDLHKLDLPVPSDGVVWSPDGTKLLLGNSLRPDGKSFRPVVVNPDGSGYHRLDTPGSFTDMYCAAWSPDGTRLLCGIADEKDPAVAGIVTIDASTGGDMRRLSSGAFPGVKGTKSECGGGDSPGDWSPDGSQIVFVRHHCGTKPDPVHDERASVYVTAADGSGTPQLIVSEGNINSGEAQIRWSPDGQWLLFTNGTLTLVRPNGFDYRQVLTALVGSPFFYSPAWSPDGTQIIVTAYRPGYTSDLFVMQADGTLPRKVTDGAASEESVSWTR